MNSEISQQFYAKAYRHDRLLSATVYKRGKTPFSN